LNVLKLQTSFDTSRNELNTHNSRDQEHLQTVAM